MFVLASISVIGTAPIPSVFILLHRLQEKFTHNIRSTPFYDLSLFLAYHLPQLFLRQLIQLFPPYCIHDELGSLVNVEVYFLCPVESEVVRIYTLFALLAETLLEVGTDGVSWILIFIGVISFQAIHIIIQRVEKSCFFFGFFLELSLLKFFCFQFGHRNTLMLDSLFYSFDKSTQM